MADWSDAFLQTYMQGNAERAQQKLAVQQFQWQNMWNQAKAAQDQQQHAAELAQKSLYEQGLLANDKTKADSAAARDQSEVQERLAGILAKGGKEVQPTELNTVPTGAPGLPAAGSPQYGPALAMHTTANLPQGVNEPAALQAPPPPNTISLAGKQIKIPTQAEQTADTQQQRSAALDAALAAGQITPDQHKAIGSMMGLENITGHAPNEAEMGALGLGKAAAVKEGDEPLGATAANVNRMTLDRLKVLDPNITEVPPHLQVTPQTTKNQYAVVHQNLQGVEAAKAAVANAKNATEDRAARLALSQQMAELAKGREADRISNENEKYIGPARDAAQNWQDYRAKGEFTGPGDEGLMDSYLRLINQGGRGVTKTQQELLLKAQSVKNSIAGMWAHATGGKLFSDDLRNQIGDQIEALAKVRQDGLANKGKAATTPSIPAVPIPVLAAPGARPPLSSFGR